MDGQIAVLAVLAIAFGLALYFRGLGSHWTKKGRRMFFVALTVALYLLFLLMTRAELKLT